MHKWSFAEPFSHPAEQPQLSKGQNGLVSRQGTEIIFFHLFSNKVSRIILNIF